VQQVLFKNKSNKMKKDYRYILEPYKGMKTRYRCPNCGQKEKTFAVYIDTQTGEHLHPTVGRCNREINCGYHYTPKQYLYDNNITVDNNVSILRLMKSNAPHPPSVSYIPAEIFKASLSARAYKTNNFVTFLVELFGVKVAGEVVSRYFIATSKKWNGATVFWQIDTQGKVRTGKIMLYNPVTGRRIKKPFNHISWVHTAIKLPSFQLRQCFFGEHLLTYNRNPVAIVESEKTATIASVYLPQFIWLAVGSLNNLNEEKCKILKGRFVSLFPDINGYERWSIKAKELSHLAEFTVSDLLERKATPDERANSFDIADYLQQYDLTEFLSDLNVEETRN
jgi:hypothetical protein